MPRLTISLPQNLHKHVSSLAVQSNESLSNVINRLLQVGVLHANEEKPSVITPLEQYCQQVIIQMGALIKLLSVEILHYEQEDFAKLRERAIAKYNELVQSPVR